MFAFLKKKFSNLSQEQYSSLRVIKNSFWRINWIKTIIFNFKALPFKQAILLPFIIGYNIKIKSIGTIKLTNKCFAGMVSIGVIKISGWESNAVQTIFRNSGTIVFRGLTKIHPGAKLSLSKDALLIMGERNSIGYNSRIICHHTISLGDDFNFSWDSQMFDTDFHFLKKIENGKIYNRAKPVFIGNNTFVGNRTTIGKGTILTNGCVVSCCSKINGDFSAEGDNLLIVGNPGKVVAKGYVMGISWNSIEEEKISDELNEIDSIKRYNEKLLKTVLNGK